MYRNEACTLWISSVAVIVLNGCKMFIFIYTSFIQERGLIISTQYGRYEGHACILTL